MMAGDLFAFILDAEGNCLKTVTPSPLLTTGEQSDRLHDAFNEAQIEFHDIDFTMYLCRSGKYNGYDECIAIYNHKAGELKRL